ncbi:Bromodomain [Trypanosoma melophagium]|uniref:Bromodomain n=1 Tax=Trypanosoma melophagium TaxID=715481 RepID=UPI00351A1125|nr:Bromodomain [Trypanosoma melophagium]
MSKREREGTLDKRRCLAFVRRLWDLDELRMFHHPVSSAELPDYHTIVRCPIDLSTIRRNIEADMYTADADVQNAVAQMIANALEYNKKGTAWHRQALSFRKMYLDLARQSGLAIDVDDAYIPSRAFKDDESTLRKAEKRNEENLGSVLKELEAEKEVPLEELIAKYKRVGNTNGDDKADSKSDSDSDDEEDEDEEEEGEEEETDDEEDEDEDDDDDDDDDDESS